jgi:hypothetical protein
MFDSFQNWFMNIFFPKKEEPVLPVEQKKPVKKMVKKATTRKPAVKKPAVKKAKK